MSILENINLFDQGSRTNRQTDWQTDRITMSIQRFALKCVAR